MPTRELENLANRYIKGEISRTAFWYQLNALSYLLNDTEFMLLAVAIKNWKAIEEGSNV